MHSGGAVAGRAAVLVLGSIVIWSYVATPAAADTYLANRTSDPQVFGACTPKHCTVREAVIRANAHGGPDTVVLRGRKTYELAKDGDDDNAQSGDLDVTGETAFTVKGKGRATVDADGLDRVFNVFDDTRMTRLVIRGGVAQGGGGIAIASAADLTVSGSAIVENQAGNGAGLAEGDRVTIKRTTIADNTASGNGGGIYNPGQLTLTDSTVSGNEATEFAGALEVGTDATIRNSTFSRNEAEDGGAIRVDDQLLQITNSTFTGNRATDSGGAIFAEGSVSANAITMVRNRADDDNFGGGQGGGIANVSGVTIANSIVALNTVGASGIGPNCSGFGSSISSGGHNIRGNLSGCTWNAGPGDVVANPKVGKLADNGGPTRTIALKAGSPAINKAGANAPPRDQRHIRRRNPDIGAFERR